MIGLSGNLQICQNLVVHAEDMNRIDKVDPAANHLLAFGEEELLYPKLADRRPFAAWHVLLAPSTLE